MKSKILQPIHYKIQRVYIDGSIGFSKVLYDSRFVAAVKAEYAAREDNVDFVLLWHGNVDEENPDPELLINQYSTNRENILRDSVAALGSQGSIVSGLTETPVIYSHQTVFSGIGKWSKKK